MILQALNSTSTSVTNTMVDCLVMLARGHRLPPPPQDLHLCPICSKGFTSHRALGGATLATGSLAPSLLRSYHQTGQALGGHKRKYYLEGGSSSSSVGWIFIFAPSAVRSSPGGCSVSSAALVRPGIHKYNICHRLFQTGQALDGHKRKHYLEGGPSSSSVGVRDFDLNMPASGVFGSWMDDEEEVQNHLPLQKRRIYLEPR